ncbi:ANTAR domain-containing protein [Arthrobacter sp. Soc17.1.1.1]|uniref:ANTAR domain-containing protein n=1 Tax=Arthrobacter sp. Soc17.1.1.1 TaxID=3121277 RepID=UPI002FE46808
MEQRGSAGAEGAVDRIIAHARGIFEATSSAYSLMDPEYVIIDVNPAFADLVGIPAADLVGRQAFEVFAESPSQSGQDPARVMRESLDHVKRTGQRDSLLLHRFDIPDPARPGAFLERYWSPVNSPVLDDEGRVVALLQEVHDVTEHREDLVRLLDYLSADPDASDADRSQRFAEYSAATMVTSGLYRSARQEVEQLQEAMRSRAGIEQAKGILMAQHHCTSDEAFLRLQKLSNDTNVRLKDVATAIIYQATAPRRGE